MEQWVDQAWGSTQTPNGYTNYFSCGTIDWITGSAHPVASIHPRTDPIDVTVTRNVYGWELSFVSGGLHVEVYFNGAHVGALVPDFAWKSSPFALLMGWNPKTTTRQPAVMSVWRVSIWSKTVVQHDYEAEKQARGNRGQ